MLQAMKLPTGEMGTLKIKGDSAALCYWNAHEKSKETFAGDWCTTGDQFHVDNDGYYWYHGRTDDMLKVSGIFVAPAEIENCLLQHRGSAGMRGHRRRSGRRSGQTESLRCAARRICPKSKVQSPKSTSPTENSKHFVKSRLAPYKYPRWIEFVDSLPKNDRGKIDRKMLKKVLA